MESIKLEVGGIYITEWDRRPMRVIGFDEMEVFYDCLWPDNSWTFSGNFKKRCFFYRSSTERFEQNSKKIDFLPLTNEEFNIFRPDLPLRIGKTEILNWNQFEFTSYEAFNIYVRKNFEQSFYNQRIDSPSIILIPYGPDGGLKKGTKVSADNGQYFMFSEIVWKSKEIQESANKKVSKGIGLYRIGFEKGIPSYYIGEFIDKA